MSSYTKEELENMLEDVVNVLDLSNGMIEKHGRMGTPPADLVKEVLDRKNLEISAIRRGFNVLNINEMTEEEINKEARKYAQPYFDEAFKHTTPSVSAICEHEGQYLINAFKEGARLALSNQWNDASKELPEDGKKVFVLTENGNGSLNSVYTFNGNRKWHSNYKVAYWMPIPQLQKEETK